MEPTPTASDPTPERLRFWRRWQAYVLDAKGLHDDSAVLDAVAFDRAVADAAARRLAVTSTRELVERFLPDEPGLVAAVMAASDEAMVNHLGFQIRQPMDVWLEGLGALAERSGATVIGTKRFTASTNFAERVGAFVEMAQVWLALADTSPSATVELEAFDIHRANPTVGDGPSLEAMLAHDDIWHYGVRLASSADVEQLHEQFADLVARDRRYELRNRQTVANRWHGSVHTKVTNNVDGTEIEFLTYDVDWGQQP